MQVTPTSRNAHTGAVHTAVYTIIISVARRVATILHNMQEPISLILAVWICVLLLGQAISWIMQPICFTPLISQTEICSPWNANADIPVNLSPWRADYSSLVNIQSKTFEQLLEDAAGGSALSLEIKKAEIATMDLVVRIQLSNLKSKDTLAATLDEFISDAKKTGRGLQRWTAKVGGAVDRQVHEQTLLLFRCITHKIVSWPLTTMR